jgi:hypothetical protein
MVPSKTHPKWTALLQDRVDYKFSNAAASMLLFQLKCDLKRDTSPAVLAKSVDTMHAFVTKYQRMLDGDIKAIFN